MLPRDKELELVDLIAKTWWDPYLYALIAFPWGKKGTFLEDYEGPDAFQTRVLVEIGRQLREIHFGRAPTNTVRIAVSSGHGVGKALAHGEPVLTPIGWRAVETLQVGEQVIAGDGTATRILGVYPQGERELYRVTLDDGTCVDVDGEHRWLTTSRSERKHGKPGKVRTTNEIAASLTFPNGPRVGLNHELPVVGAVQHPRALLPIEPYLFGCWLGDGDAMGRITGEEPAFEQLQAAGAELGIVCRDRRRPNVITRGALGIRPGLRALGLYGCRSHEKHIPRLYLHASIEQRTAILQGLLDTDGTAQKNGAVVFETTAPGLADGVAELVRSLGGVIRRGTRQGSYAGKECRLVYRLYLSLPRGLAPFRLPAKVNRYRPQWGSKNCDRTRRRFIASVESIGRGQATCIAVEHPSHLFVTRDHIVTHNTALMAMIELWWQSTRPNSKSVTTAGTKTQLTTKTWRELEKWRQVAINGHWFEWTATSLKMIAQPVTWAAEAIPWSANNPQAFAGTHEQYVLVKYDEASTIDDTIWETTEGAFTTHGPHLWLAFGNPEQAAGRFRECWTKHRHRWITIEVDARQSRFSNKKLIEEWIKTYGEDSDFVRVRVKGMPPKTPPDQFIPTELWETCESRWEEASKHEKEIPRGIPLVMGVDPGAGGEGSTTILFRRGGFVYKNILRYSEADQVKVAGIIGQAIRDYKPLVVFIDAHGIGWGVYNILQQLGFTQVVPCFAGDTKQVQEPQVHYNQRVEWWSRMKEWMKTGALPPDTMLREDLLGPKRYFNLRMQMLLESKDDMKLRGFHSPHAADALALTFAMPLPSAQELLSMHDVLPDGAPVEPEVECSAQIILRRPLDLNAVSHIVARAHVCLGRDVRRCSQRSYPSLSARSRRHGVVRLGSCRRWQSHCRSECARRDEWRRALPPVLPGQGGRREDHRSGRGADDAGAHGLAGEWVWHLARYHAVGASHRSGRPDHV